ncbi:MAG: betaine-aldehyde dehydrogenase [Desulfomicrobium sp.]|nr:betaine-aldehyde dehydrogenase [Pseudomonadota bacterium]MBV1712219.1 betaine-aldehyde dehydrogenase [Desulfomicrobium sp.]MBU4572857.1 betaine-aldehyde dehydrogenase [Pseudomonadota bacterium]MBU4594852.1 betaine-aldehyde dehydrogenase [Pseudomonadota bacterium]MBV1718509.1 betaine-aldehyde dehydrogenase [Desulfomicrobium sp.]
MTEKMMHFDGRWTRAQSSATRDIINPFDQGVIATVTEGSREDARDAIDAARCAFDKGPWSRTTGPERGRKLLLLADLIERDAEELARLETLNTGKTLEESRWDMADIAGIFRYYAGLADKDAGEVIASPVPDSTSIVVREPVGVCGQISPWNYPLLQAAWKLAPALAAGCTVVIKPSEITPLTTIKVTELCQQAGFPEGVVNLVLGPGATVGAELAENPNVDLISFTGGIETGKTIMRAAAANVKKVALELGGKNPNIIFDDADFDTALDYILNGVFFHAGQICSAGARVLLQDGIHDRMVDALKDRMAKIRLGDGMTDGTQMGPLISAAHRDKVESYIRIASEEGARLLLGGKRPTDPALANGFFVEPTLFTDCTNDMRIVQEEVFGPVISIERFTTEDEALTRANSTIYGLSAGFWTRDPDRIRRMSTGLRFGTVWVNDFNVYFTQAPWGGYKQSGLGRELGRIGLEEYTEVKHIFQNHNARPIHWFGV